MTSMPSAAATARRARSTLAAALGGLAQVGDEARLVGAGELQPLLEGEALGLEAHGHVLEALLHLAADEGLGQLVGDQLGQGLADASRAAAIWAWARLTLVMPR